MDIDILKARAAKREEYPVRVQFSDDKLVSLKDQLSQKEIAREDLDEAFKEERTAYNVEKKQMSDEARELRGQIRKRYVDEKRECYFVPNFDTGMMEIYDCSNGTIVESRRLHPTERQTSLVTA